MPVPIDLAAALQALHDNEVHFRIEATFDSIWEVTIYRPPLLPRLDRLDSSTITLTFPTAEAAMNGLLNTAAVLYPRTIFACDWAQGKFERWPEPNPTA
jgi:hypothetical protein